MVAAGDLRPKGSPLTPSRRPFSGIQSGTTTARTDVDLVHTTRLLLLYTSNLTYPRDHRVTPLSFSVCFYVRVLRKLWYSFDDDYVMFKTFYIDFKVWDPWNRNVPLSLVETFWYSWKGLYISLVNISGQKEWYEKRNRISIVDAGVFRDLASKQAAIM